MRFIVLLLLAGPLPAQSAHHDELLGDSLFAIHRPGEALAAYRRALATDSLLYPALWKAARAAVDLAKVSSEADTLYRLAADLAERAIRADSLDAEGHFMLALALGRLSRTLSGPARLRYGRLIHEKAARALALSPTHDGAHHVLGAWHAEVRRLPGTTRFLAGNLFGARFLEQAAWDSAVAHLERAVELRPRHIYHRLELAEIYRDLERYAAAREQLRVISSLPGTDILDAEYKRRAAELFSTLDGKE